MSVGIIVGENNRGKGHFFTSWDSKELYYGEEVRVKKDYKYADFYNDSCGKIIIVGLQATKTENVALIRLEECNFPSGYTDTAFDSISQELLEKAK